MLWNLTREEMGPSNSKLSLLSIRSLSRHSGPLREPEQTLAKPRSSVRFAKNRNGIIPKPGLTETHTLRKSFKN